MTNYLYSTSCALILYLSTFMQSKVSTTPKPVDEWFDSVEQLKETKTKLHFYIQDVFGGANPTVWKIAESVNTSQSAVFFGQLNMVDNLVTSGPEADSGVVGRAQGTAGFAGLNELAYQISFNFVFTEGNYEESTISLLGRFPSSKPEREMSIVGGTGVFRLARGVAVATSYAPGSTAERGVMEYKLYVIHYTT